MMYINPADHNVTPSQFQYDYDAELKQAKEQVTAILQDASLGDGAKREEIYTIKRHLDEIEFTSLDKMTEKQRLDYTFTSMDLGSIIFAFDYPENPSESPQAAAPSPMSVLTSILNKVE